LFFIWYSVVRFGLETFRSDNWTWFGIPTAMVVSTIFVVAAVVTLAWRHRPGHPTDPPPTYPAVATWGALGSVEPVATDGDDADDDAAAAHAATPDDDAATPDDADDDAATPADVAASDMTDRPVDEVDDPPR
jgi:hypothetical protein